MPGTSDEGADATRQRVTHTLCGGAGPGRSRTAGTPFFSAASESRRPERGSAARVSPSTAAMPGQRSPSSMAQKRSSSRRTVTTSRRAGSNQADRAGA